jgi:hypothetical protein
MKIKISGKTLMFVTGGIRAQFFQEVGFKTMLDTLHIVLEGSNRLGGLFD